MTPEEHIRHAALVCLYGTRKIRVATSYVAREVGRATGATTADVEVEMAFLLGAGLIDAEHDGLGSSQYWRLTPAGILHYERHR